MKFTGDRPWQGARVKSSSPVLGKNGPDFPPLGGETPLLMSVLSVSALAGSSPAPKLSVRSLRRSRPCLNHKLYEVVCVGAVERDQAGSFELPGSDSARRTRKKSSSFPRETSGERRGLEADVVRSFWWLRSGWHSLSSLRPIADASVVKGLCT